jgi:hypothetical protein
MTEKLQLRDAVYMLEDTIREIRNRFVDDRGRVDEIAFGESKADPVRAAWKASRRSPSGTAMRSPRAAPLS